MTEHRPVEPDRVGDAPHPRETQHLFGQQAAEEQFLAAHRSGRLHHAWMITGPLGVGKATLAWRIARFLLASAYDSRTGEDRMSRPIESLEVNPDHPVARRIAALSEPTLKLVRRAADQRTARLQQQITVGEIRSLTEFFALSSSEGLPLVAIIDAADEMNTNSANALLKLLEEPPPNTYLLLVSHSPYSLLPTIRSRCSFLKCQPLSNADLRLALAAAGVRAIDDQAALAELSGGSAGVAVRLQLIEGLAVYKELLDLMAGAPGIQRAKAAEFAAACDGPAANLRFDASVSAILQMLARLARFSTGNRPAEAVAGETGCFSRLCAGSDAPRVWAELATEFFVRASHSRDVNLDPFSVVLDMLLTVDRSATAALR